MAVEKEQIFENPNFVIQTPDCVKTFLQKRFSKRTGYKPSRAMKLCLILLSRMQTGRLDVVLQDGQTLRFQGEKVGPNAILRVHNDRMAKRFLTGGKLGFCESYLDGDWSSPDIAVFFELMLRNAQAMKKTMMGKKWVRALSYFVHILQPNTRKGSRKNIYAHYDIGNDFYTKWLDPSMTYSSALFRDTDDLEEAQDAKYQEMIDRMGLQPNHHVLEIGCGWGGFAEYAARTVGCKVTAITVSKAQHEYATHRIEKAGLSGKVEIRLQDYRDVRGKFDRIASVEMFEAVGEKYWPTFFGTLKRRLKSGGRAVLQIITIDDQEFHNYRRSADYIQRYIFPGGMLPSMQALAQQIGAAGLKKGDHLSFGKDYARTLDLWNDAFQENWGQIKGPKLNDRFKRMWEQYLCYCQAGFEVGTIDVIQINIDKP